MIRKSRVSLTLYFLSIASLLSSCSLTVKDKSSSITDTQEYKVNKSLHPPNNVVKVLNSVVCQDCNQDQVNNLWQECLNQGYSTSSPSRNVKSSRELKELVQTQYTYYEDVNYTQLNTDTNGVVYESQVTKPKIRYLNLKGQCVGSEYILE